MNRYLCYRLSQFGEEIRQAPREQCLQRLGRGESMLPAGRKITPNPAEDLRSFDGPKATRDFLLKLCHANIVFALVVRKRHDLIGHESQRFSFKFAQTLQQTARLRFGDAATLTGVGPCLWGRAPAVASSQDIAIPAAETLCDILI